MSNNWQFHITKSKVLKWLQLCSPEEAHEDLTLKKECSASYVSCCGYQDSLSDGGSTIKKNKIKKLNSVNTNCSNYQWVRDAQYPGGSSEMVPPQLQIMLLVLSNPTMSTPVCKLCWALSPSRKLWVQQTKFLIYLVQSLGIKTKMTAKLLKPFYHAP